MSPSPPLWHSRLPFLTLQFLLSPVPTHRHTHTHTHTRTQTKQRLLCSASVPILKHCQRVTHPFASSLFCRHPSQILRKSHLFFPIGNSIMSRSFSPCQTHKLQRFSPRSTHISGSRLNFLCCGCLQQRSAQCLQCLERFTQIGCCSFPPLFLSLLSHKAESKQAARRLGACPDI